MSFAVLTSQEGQRKVDIGPQQEVVLFLVHPPLSISLGCFFSNTPNAHAQTTPTHFRLSGCCNNYMYSTYTTLQYSVS